MLTCQKCGGFIPDIGVHNCYGPKLEYSQPPQYIPPIRPVKCDICGSTAIDHTETQCIINRQANNSKKISK